MFKFKTFYNLDKEERWLNELGRQGYKLTGKTSFGYRFESSNEEVVTRMDYRKFKRQSDFEDYKALFEDSGWEHLVGTKGSGFQYFRRLREQPDEDIFSDLDSKAGRYKRLSQMWLTSAYCMIPIFAALVSTDMIDPSVWMDPKQLYLTQGLWEMEGARFWRAFLFETPFAVFRALVWTAIPIMILLYSLFSYQAERRYKQLKTPPYQ